MIRLNHLYLEAFRSFRDANQVALPEKGAVLVRAINKDTGGTSAAGKTSLLLSIAYALGYCPYPATHLQNWHNEEPMSVTLCFDVDGVEYKLHRGKRPILVSDKDKWLGATAVNTNLPRVLGTTPDILKALTYRGQRRHSYFLSMGDAEKKDFLSTVLGLEKYEKMAEDASERASQAAFLVDKLADDFRMNEAREPPAPEPAPTKSWSLEKTDDQLRAELLSITAERQTNAVLLQESRQNQKRLDAECAAELQTALEPLETELALLKRAAVPGYTSEVYEEKKKLLGQIETRVNRLVAESDKRTREFEQAQRLHAHELAQTRALANTKPGIEKKLVELEKTKAKLLSAQCPTCERPWDETKSEIETVDQKIAELQVQLLNANDAVTRSAQLSLNGPVRPEPDPMMERMRQAKNSVLLEMSKEQEKAQTFRDSWNQQQRLKISEKTNAILNQKSIIQERYKGLNNELVMQHMLLLEKDEAARKREDRVKEDLTDLRIQREKFEARNRERQAWEALQLQLGDALVKAQENHKLESDFAVMVGRKGFLGAIFDEVLEEISQETNQVLAGVPNTSHVSLRFRSEKGGGNRSITPVVSVGGQEAPIESALSGGQESAVELAVDLAISAVVSRRTGVQPGWLILDEPFEGLGPVEKEGCMEIIAAYARDKLVLVIDHSTEFKEMFSRHINIEFEAGVSTILEA